MMTQHECDVLLVTHTGIPWQRRLADGRLVVNVGAIGRPANDGRREVWYALVTSAPTAASTPSSCRSPTTGSSSPPRCAPKRCRAEFVETVETGWWTTCLEILPPKERARGKY